MNESVKKTVEAVIRTLNDIEIKGRNNMDMLLGCILALESALNQKEEEVNPDEQ